VCVGEAKKLVLGLISFCIFINGVKEGIYSQHLAPLGSECPREKA